MFYIYETNVDQCALTITNVSDAKYQHLASQTTIRHRSSVQFRPTLPSTSPPTPFTAVMAFFDVEAYAAHMRRQNALLSGLTTGLAFNPIGTPLASLSTSGQLSIQDLPTNSDEVSPICSALFPGKARTLEAGSAGLYAGGSEGLLLYNWDAVPQHHVLEDSVVATASLNGGHIVSAFKQGWAALVDEELGQAVDVVAGEARIDCLAALPGGQSQFVAVSISSSTS